MKRFFSLILALSLLVGCMSVLTACGSADDDGAQFNVYVGEAIYDFDPTEYYVNANAEKVMSLIFEPLFVLDDDGDVKMGMADDYEINKKERKITIDIRDSEWSNGVRVLANDFIYAWRNAILDANTANPASALFYDIEGALEVKNGEIPIDDIGLSNDGPQTIVIKYREGADPEQLIRNLASVAASPVCQNVHEKAQDTWSKYLDTLACNGPFYVKTLNYEKGLFTLARNNGYHQITAEIEEGDDPAEHVTPYVLFSDFGTDNVLDRKCDKCNNVNPSINKACRDANDDGICDSHEKQEYKDGCEACKDEEGTDLKCDNCGASGTKAVFECTAHDDKNEDGKCDSCKGLLSAFCENHVDKIDGKCDACGKDYVLVLPADCPEHEDGDDNGKCDTCAVAFDDGCEDCKLASAGVLKLSYSDIENNTVFYMGDANLADRAANKDKAVVSDVLSTYTYLFNTKTETVTLHESDCEDPTECECATTITLGSVVSDVNVRKALSLAIDREAIIKAVVFGKAATGFIPGAVSSELRETDLIKTTAQTAEAKSLMKTALDKLLAPVHTKSCAKDDTCVCPSAISLEKIHISCCSDNNKCNCPARVIIDLLISDNEQSRTIASLAKKSWEALDSRLYVNIVTETHSYNPDASEDATDNYYDSIVQQTVIANASTNNTAEKYSFDIVAVDWCMYTNDPFVGLASMSQKFGGYGVVYPSTDSVGGADYVVGEDPELRRNATAWYSKAYDEYIATAYNSTDKEARMAALAAAEKLLISEMPVMPIMFNQSFAFVNENLKNLEVDGNGYHKFTEVENKLWDSETHMLVLPEKKDD